MNRKLKVEIGDKYGKWVVLGEEIEMNKSRYVFCCCDCGKEKFIHISNLISGKSKSCKSCGHIGKCNNLKHDESVWGKRSFEYVSWCSMKDRCHNKNSKDYWYYGGRGIRVCERWKTSFENFLLDMGRKPTKFHTLDRKNNDKGYEPGNCRWATYSEQRCNQRRYQVKNGVA